MKKKLCLIATLVAFFAMTAVSFAAVTVDVDVTSQPIQYQSLCDKAGGLTLNFVDGTIFESGDRMTADLPRTVTLCRSFDFIVGLNTEDSDADPIGYLGALPAVGIEDQGPVTGDGDLIGGSPVDGDPLGPIAFHVYGVAGTQRVTIDVVADVDSDGSLEFADGIHAMFSENLDNGVMILEILDSRVHAPNTFFAQSSAMWSNYDADDWYDDETIAADNTFCINTSLHQSDYVNTSWDSKDQKYTFDPSTTQVAHAVTQTALEFAACNKQECGYIVGYDEAGQEQYICTPIDNEAGDEYNYAEPTDGYCYPTHRQNRVVIQQTNGQAIDIDDSEYQIQLEILVDGEKGDRGVYFATGLYSDGYATKGDACTENAMESHSLYLYNASNQSNPFDSGYAASVNTDLALAGAQSDCDIDEDNRIVKIKTYAGDLGLDGVDDDFLFIDLPLLIWDRDLFVEGQKLEILVSILKAPCGTIFSEPFCIGVLGCEETVDPDACYEYTGFYPLVAKDAAYASVLHVTNTGSTSINVTGYIYETDGDIWMFTGVVAANGVAAYNVWAQTLTAAPGSTGDSVPGNNMGYAKVVADGNFAGVAFITNGTNGESMGYVIDCPTSTAVPCP